MKKPVATTRAQSSVPLSGTTRTTPVNGAGSIWIPKTPNDFEPFERPVTLLLRESARGTIVARENLHMMGIKGLKITAIGICRNRRWLWVEGTKVRDQEPRINRSAVEDSTALDEQIALLDRSGTKSEASSEGVPHAASVHAHAP